MQHNKPIAQHTIQYAQCYMASSYIYITHCQVHIYKDIDDSDSRANCTETQLLHLPHFEGHQTLACYCTSQNICGRNLVWVWNYAGWF